MHFSFALHNLHCVVCLKLYLVHGFIACPLDADVDHGVGEGAAHVELQGQVVDTLKKLRYAI